MVLRAACVTAVGRVMLLSFYMSTAVAGSNTQHFQGASAKQVMYDLFVVSSLLIVLSLNKYLSRRLFYTL